MRHAPESVARLLITCPDKPGIVAAVTTFLANHGANITALDQYSTDPEGGTFFMRLEFQTPHLNIARPALESAFENVVARPFQMDWRISYAEDLKTMALLVSREEHCLLELLWRWSRGELPARLAMVISNHPDHARQVEAFGVPFQHVPFSLNNKVEAEARMLELLGPDLNLVVLARYMQVLSPEFVGCFRDRIINIHHSFLPAFVGADPYRQARERGVKLIGATAHYVTEELDGGPIIEQDVTRVSHRDTVDDLKDAGRNMERHVLAKAVRWHLEDRIIIHAGKTVVFLS